MTDCLGFEGGVRDLDRVVRLLAMSSSMPHPTDTKRVSSHSKELSCWFELSGLLGTVGRYAVTPSLPVGLVSMLEPSLPSSPSSPSSPSASDGLAFTQVFLCAGVPIARDEAEVCFAATLADEKDHSRVYSIDLAGALGVVNIAASITSFVVRFSEGDEARARLLGEFGDDLDRQVKAFEKSVRTKLPAPHNPEKLYWRTLWLVGLLHQREGFGREEELAKAEPFSAYAEERKVLSSWPHLATYWIWSHWAFGNDRELADALELTKDVAHPFVLESHDVVTRLHAGESVMLGGRDRDALVAARDTLREVAPARVFGPAVRAERTLAKKVWAKARKDELAELRRLYAGDARIDEALGLLGELERETSLDGNPKVSRFVEIVDDRLRPLLLERLRDSAAWAKESDRSRATPGLVLAWAKLARDFAEFERVLSEVGGTHRYKRLRVHELILAYRRFAEPEATARLVEAADRFLRDEESRDREAGGLEAFAELLHRDSPQLPSLVTRFLRRRDFGTIPHEGGDRLELKVISVAAERRILDARDAIDAIAKSAQSGIWPSIAVAAAEAAKRLHAE